MPRVKKKEREREIERGGRREGGREGGGGGGVREELGLGRVWLGGGGQRR
jgi:hypothetical protein